MFEEFDKVVNIIEKNVDKNWKTVESLLTKELGKTIRDISQRFELVANFTPFYQFQKRKAFRTMGAILNNPNKSMEKICEEYGYSDKSLFNKQIKNLTGQSPSDIKKWKRVRLIEFFAEPKYYDYYAEKNGYQKKDITKPINNSIFNVSELKKRINDAKETIEELDELIEKNEQSSKPRNIDNLILDRENRKRELFRLQEYIAREEFDKIVSVIEKNVDKNWETVETLLTKELGMTTQDISQRFESIADFTPFVQFQKRKAFRTMGAILNNPNKSMKKICEEYGYSDKNVFNKQIKNLTGESAIYYKDMTIGRSAEFCVGPKYYDYYAEKNGYQKKIITEPVNDSIVNVSELKKRINDAKEAIEELDELIEKNEQSDEPRNIDNLILNRENRKMELLRLQKELEEIKNGEVMLKNMTPAMYYTFLAIEERRVLYNLPVKKIVELYSKSLHEGASLDELCNEETESLNYIDYDEDDEYEFYEELEEYCANEMSIAEAYELYYGDDEYSEEDDIYAEDPYDPDFD